MPIFYYLINDEINKKYILRFSLSFLLFPILLIYYSLENYSNIKVKDYINFNNEVTKYVNKNDIKNSYLFIQNNINIDSIKNFKDFELINKNFKLPIDLKLNGYIIINSEIMNWDKDSRCLEFCYKFINSDNFNKYSETIISVNDYSLYKIK